MCGFVGIISPDPVAPALTLGLQAIQHRGQDAAGVGTLRDGRFHVVKACGLVTAAITTDDMTAKLNKSELDIVQFIESWLPTFDRWSTKELSYKCQLSEEDGNAAADMLLDFLTVKLHRLGRVRRRVL